MIPFQRAYLTVIVVIFLILAGNTAFVRDLYLWTSIGIHFVIRTHLQPIL